MMNCWPPANTGTQAGTQGFWFPVLWLVLAGSLAMSPAMGQSTGSTAGGGTTGPATGSTLDSTVAGLPDSSVAAGVVEEISENLPEELPEPTAAAVEVPEVNLWSTGVSPTAAVLSSPFFPGWGQLYSDNYWKAGLGFGVQMYFLTNILNRDRQAVRARDFAYTFPVDDPNYTRYNSIAEESWEQMRDFAWWSGGILLIIALDAYVDAHLFNFDQDPVPVPDRWDDTFGPVGESVGMSDPGPTMVVFQWRKKF